MTPFKVTDQDRSFVTPPARRSSPVWGSHPGSTASGMSRIISPDAVPERQEKGPRPPIKPNSPVKESVMVDSRRSTEIDKDTGLYVDIPPPVGGFHNDFKSFLQRMGEKAVQLQIECYGSHWRSPEMVGQCGLIVDEKQRYTLVTAAHNTASNSKEASYVDFVALEKRENGEKWGWPIITNHRGQDIAKARRLVLRDSQAWTYGWDIDLCRVSIEDDNPRCWAGFLPWHKSSRLYEKCWAFQKTAANFEYKVGQKVAIAVSTLGCIAPTVENAVAHTSYTPQEQNNIFGPTGRVSIYSGEVTRVGIDHIEHNINTFQGCSGAIMFLLEDVGGHCRGAALAVHVGYHPGLGTNIGLKIARGFEPNLLEKLSQIVRSLQLAPIQKGGEAEVNLVTKTTESSDSDETGQDSSCSD